MRGPGVIENREATRVVHVIETLGSGGAERLLYTNLRHLDPGRFRSTVVTLYEGGEHWSGPIRALGVPVESLGLRGRRGIGGAIARLVRVLRRGGADLVHTHLLWADLVGRMAGKVARVPVISSIHCPNYEPEALEAMPGLGRRKQRLIRALDAWSARLACDRMIAVSDFVRRSTHRRLGIPLERIALIHNPIDVPELAEAPARGRDALLAGLGLPPGSACLLCVGRVTTAKGLIHAVRALPEIVARHPEAHLVCVGSTVDQAYVAGLRAEAEALGVSGHLHLAGPRRDVPDLLRACDLFVFPTLFEGLGIALAEALASGCACVATDVGPLPEVVRAGVDGCLVPPADPRALAGAVVALLDDPARRAALGREATSSALSRFHPRPAADRLAEVYESVLEARAGRDLAGRRVAVSPTS